MYPAPPLIRIFRLPVVGHTGTFSSLFSSESVALEVPVAEFMVEVDVIGTEANDDDCIELAVTFKLEKS